MQLRTSGNQVAWKVITYVAECVEENVLVSYREQVDICYRQDILSEDKSVDAKKF
jgi:hypothetical protein